MKNILGILFAAFFCGCASISISAESANSSSLDYLYNGEYAFYLDTRGVDSYYRGYMKFSTEDNRIVIFVRSININKGEEDRYMFSVEEDENGNPSGFNIIQGQFSNIYHRKAIPDFLNFTTLYMQKRNDYHIQGEIEDDWGEFVFVFSFNKVLPFFGFSDIKIKGDNQSHYTLLYGGVLDANIAGAFFRLNPENKQPQQVVRQTPTIPSKKEKKVKLNGVSITLDENWQFNNSTELPGYWISLASVRDSQIAVERMKLPAYNLTKENCYMFFKLAVLGMGNMLEMNSVTVSETRNGYQLECYLWERNTRNYQRIELIINGNDVAIINFSSFADIYNANKDYYEGILGSVLAGNAEVTVTF